MRLSRARINSFVVEVGCQVDSRVYRTPAGVQL
jgi:hypothetical protein